MKTPSWNNLQASAYRGKIGIWWVNENRIFMFAHDVEDGRVFDGNVHCIRHHQAAWRDVVLLNAQELEGWPYDYLPRGRVYYDTSSKNFNLIGTPLLVGLPKFVDFIKKNFDIHDELVSDQSSDAAAHYTGDLAPNFFLLKKVADLYR